MKYIYIIFLLLGFTASVSSCVDDPLPEKHPSDNPDFNIEEFSDGYSIAFDVSLDNLGEGMGSRAETIDDAMLAEWENYLNPEEFRVLFFDENDQFLFESKSRWMTSIGNNKWRIGVPVFQYLSDEYDDNGSNDGVKIEDEYNWEEIVKRMSTNPFKIAVLANRPTSVELPDLTDWPTNEGGDLTAAKIAEFKIIQTMDVADNGPFWTAQNSIATEDRQGKEVATVLDLHHCQFDPIYYNKTFSDNFKGNGWYDFIMKFQSYDYPAGKYNDGTSYTKGTFSSVPYMGAVSSWISSKRIRTVFRDEKDNEVRTRQVRFYKLPIDRIVAQDHVTTSGTNLPYESSLTLDKPQYIPMYGIQTFRALTEWAKGTTFNLSQQTGSQTGDYDYTRIYLLRSVVKLEVRIPKYDKTNKQYIDVDNKWAQIWFNNYMARCEPMDVSTSTRDIWSEYHDTDCEWLRIKNYGLLADDSEDFKKRLSWFYGIWSKLGWNFGDHSNDFKSGTKLVSENDAGAYPRIFNPITQRLQSALITDCYLPTDDYHRWVIYCGERNMNDPNKVGDLTTDGYVSFFRIKVTKKQNPYDSNGTDFIYYIPITDYSKSNNPASDYLVESNIATDKGIDFMGEAPAHINGYYGAVKQAYANNNLDGLPLPLLRNHFYRLTVSFGDNEDINVQVMNSEQRNVGLGEIIFN